MFIILQEHHLIGVAGPLNKVGFGIAKNGLPVILMVMGNMN